MKKITGVLLCCAVVGGVAAVGFLSRMGPDDAAPVAAQLSEINVSVAKPVRGSLAQTTSFIGTVQPEESVQVFPKASGTVLRTYFEIGEPVQKGQLLFEIDPEMAQLQYNAARIAADAQLGSGYDTQLVTMKSSLNAAQSALNTARDNLKNLNDGVADEIERQQRNVEKFEKEMENLDLELDRISGMSAEELKATYGADADRDRLLVQKENARTTAYEQYVYARDRVDELEDDDDPQLRSARTAYRNAKNSYNAAKEAYDLTAGVSREDAEAVSEAQLQIQAKSIEYTRVTAPISGIIEQKNVSEQNPAPSGQPSYVISNKSIMTVRFGVSESVMQNLSIGEEIEIEAGGQTTVGTITEIPTAVDAQTGLFNIKASIDGEQIQLHTGATVKLYAATQKATDSIILPIDCLYYDAEQPYVYLYRNGKAVKTEVQTGVSSETEIAVLSGLSENDRVITSWHPRLLDGAEVVVQGDENAVVAVSAAVGAAEKDTDASSGESPEAEETASTPEDVVSSESEPISSAASSVPQEQLSTEPNRTVRRMDSDSSSKSSSSKSSSSAAQSYASGLKVMQGGSK